MKSKIIGKTLHQELTALHKKARALSQEFENIGKTHVELLDNMGAWHLRQGIEQITDMLRDIAEEYEGKEEKQ